MDIVFDLLKPPSLSEAQALTTWLQKMPGMISALVDPDRRQISVSFESSRITDMEIREALIKRHVPIGTEEHSPSVSTEEVGFTRKLEGERRDLDAEARAQRNADIDLAS